MSAPASSTTNAKDYLTDNWTADVGHPELGGKNALAFGSEIARPLGHGKPYGLRLRRGASRPGQFHGTWAGLKFYFGRWCTPPVG